jgi:1-acyl-sn-glycerol-3-phosphate acyltransferase
MLESWQKSLSDPYLSKPVTWLLSLIKWLGSYRFWLGLTWARVFYRLEIDQNTYIPPKGGCIVAFNHVCEPADTIICLLIKHRRPDSYLFSWDSTIRIVSRLSDAIGLPGAAERFINVDKRGPYSAMDLLQARQILQAGGCVALAPEGEVTWDGRLQFPLAPGAAWLALHTAAPVIPIVSQGGYDIQPVWYREKIHLTGRIRIRGGKPLILCEQPVEEVTSEQLQAANQLLWDALAELLKK